jgi:hypothetical protein
MERRAPEEGGPALFSYLFAGCGPGGMSGMNLWSVASLVFLLNIPFGYWRANEKKLSTRWFLSVHAPVPFVIALRLVSGLGWHWITFPVMISAFFAGQFAGGWFHRLRRNRDSQVSSCLVWDLVGVAQRKKQ